MAGEKIQYTSDGKLVVPDQPIIPYIEGMGWGRYLEGIGSCLRYRRSEMLWRQEKDSLARSLCRGEGLSTEKRMGSGGDNRDQFGSIN